jgi:CBS domain-containing protein
MQEHDVREVKVREIMNDEWPVLGTQQSVEEAMKLFVIRNISGAPVLRDGELVGIVTEGDLIFRDAEVEAPGVLDLLGGLVPLGSWREYREELIKSTGVTVEQVMTTEIVTVSPEDTISETATIMAERRKKLLPVVQEAELVGVISRADVLALHVLNPGN